MGMFDWYRPSEQLECPVCRTPLREWQGKSAHCALFVWQEGAAGPVDQLCDDDCRALPEVARASRLPAAFEIYSYDCGRHRVTAECVAVSGVWTKTRIAEVVDARI
jgi:hypothetical protein